MRNFNRRVFAKNSFIPLLVIKICAIGIVFFIPSFIGIDMLVLFSSISLAIFTRAVWLGNKYAPGKDKPEKLKHVIRSGTVIVITAIKESTLHRTVATCYQSGITDDVRQIILPSGDYDHLVTVNCRVGSNYELYPQ